MLTNKVSQKISTLATDLAVAVSLKDPEAWKELSIVCKEITVSLTTEAEFTLSDIASRAEEIFTQLADAKIVNLDAAVTHLTHLIQLLCQVADSDTYDQARARELVASADLYLSDLQDAKESVSFQSTVEIDEEFMQEIEGRIDSLETILFKMMQETNTNPEDSKSVFREFHTLKGEAGILGLTVLSSFWHSVEEVIQEARSGKLFFSRQAIDSLLQMVKLGRELLISGSFDAKQNKECEETLLALDKTINNNTTSSPEPAPQISEPIMFDSPDKSDIAEDEADDFFTMQPDSDESEAADETTFPEEKTTEEPMEESVDEFVEPAPSEDLKVTAKGENKLYTEPDEAPILPAIDQSPIEQAPIEQAPKEQVTASPEKDAPAPSSPPISEKKIESPPIPQPAIPASTVELMRNDEVGEIEKPAEKDVENYSLRNVQIEVKKLDELLDIVSEVSLIGSHLSNNSDISKIGSVTGDLQELMRFCRTLNDMASAFRMTPIAPLFKRIQRAANDTARLMNKQVDLIIEGQDTKVDRIVIERLSAALIHLVRNSVGHGIEPAATRRQNNKSPVGKLKLSARQAGADIIIEFGDDGTGIDVEKIKEKAINIGSLDPDNLPKDSDILNLIFSSGLSTSEEVDGISGRGVGMAIVQESMDSLRGRIEVDNKPGAGVTFRLRFPVALAAVEALLVTLGDNIIAIPIQSVRETFKLEAGQLSTIEGRGKMVNVRGIIVPIIYMSDFLGITANHNVEGGVLVLVDEGEKLAAILVDTVMETRQVVIRQLEGALRDIPEITGAALLSDRQISLVLDTRRVIERTYIASGKAYSNAGAVQAASERKVETVAIGSNAVGIIDFTIKAQKADGTIKNHTFAINAFKTREFVPATTLTAVPDMPVGFAGMLLLREETIPVMSLDILLGLQHNKERCRKFENIIIICEFSGVTVGFLVTDVNSVSYISWDNINPPPQGSPLINLNYVIGTILLETISGNSQNNILNNEPLDNIAFLLDFEQIVQQVINLYDDIGGSLSEITLRKDVTKILLVEDSPLIRRETAKALENAGIQVLQASNGLEAQKLLNQLYKQARSDQKSIFNYLDLILSDIEMPQMDGYSLTMFVKNHPDLRLLPVLLHSSLTNDTIVQRAREVHADGFIPKCAPAKLAEHLSKYI